MRRHDVLKTGLALVRGQSAGAVLGIVQHCAISRVRNLGEKFCQDCVRCRKTVLRLHQCPTGSGTRMDASAARCNMGTPGAASHPEAGFWCRRAGNLQGKPPYLCRVRWALGAAESEAMFSRAAADSPPERQYGDSVPGAWHGTSLGTSLLHPTSLPLHTWPPPPPPSGCVPARRSARVANRQPCGRCASPEHADRPKNPSWLDLVVRHVHDRSATRPSVPRGRMCSSSQVRCATTPAHNGLARSRSGPATLS